MKVVISNGSNKFHMAPAAAEAQKNGILALFITAGYPSRFVKGVLNGMRLARFSFFGRLLDREEAGIPAELVRSLWVPEILNQIGTRLVGLKLPGWGAAIQSFGMQFYGALAARLIRRSSAHVYHYRAGYGHASVRAAKRRGMITLCDHSAVHPALIAYLWENEGKLPIIAKGSPIDLFWKQILHDIDQSDYVVVNSDFVKKTFIHQGWDPERIHVIYLGVDEKFMLNTQHEVRGPVLGMPIRLLFAGGVTRKKGAHILFEALKRIPDLPWRLEIVGGLSAEFRDEYESFLADARVAVRGVLPRIELAQTMTRADIFVFPSLAEGSARVVFEALACGCFVITTPNSGSIVEDGVHGFIVRPGDVPGTEIAIRDAIQQRSKCSGIGLKNRELVAIYHTQRRYGEQLQQLYSKLNFINEQTQKAKGELFKKLI